MEQEVSAHPIRYREIDLLRFIAAFSVLVFHYTFRGYNADHLSPVRYPEIERVTKYGYLGVPLFFMISGYVVLMSAYNKNVRQFFVSRVARLYPAFWVACTLTFMANYFFGPAKGSTFWSEFMDVSVSQYIVNMTMLQQFFGVRDLDGVYWTLSYEILFYSFLSLLVAYRLLNYLPGILFLWLIYSAYTGFSFDKSLFVILLMPSFSSFFIAGMLFYLLQQKKGNGKQLVILLLGSWIVAIRTCTENALLNQNYYQTNFTPKYIILIITIFYIIFLFIILGKLNLTRYKWLSWLGALTYPIYLIHHNIGYILFQKVGNRVDKYLLLISISLVIILLAYLIHEFTEKKFSGYLRVWTYKILNWLDHYFIPI